MKRLLALLLATLMVFSLVACGKDNKTNNTTNTKTEKSETVDISKMSEDELKETALTNATAYIKQKYPDIDWNKGMVIEDADFIKQESYLNNKTFEELGIHKKTYFVLFSHSTDELANEFIADIYMGKEAYVLTDVSKTGQAGIDSCYDNYQTPLIHNAIYKEVSKIAPCLDDKYDVADTGFCNLRHFKTYYDETKPIVEFMKTSEEFKDKSSYILLTFSRTSDNVIYEEGKVYTDDEKTFLSYFTKVTRYSKLEKIGEDNELTYTDILLSVESAKDTTPAYEEYKHLIHRVYEWDETQEKFITTEMN